MPALTTHKIFAEQISKNIDKNLIDLNTFFMFSQSHDILFYYFGKNKKKYKNIGKNGHHTKTKEFIITIIDYIKNNNLQNNKQCMSYLLGTLTHYYLDSTLHPYIFYKTGVYRNNYKTKKYKGKHNLFERQLDSKIYEKTYKKIYKKSKIEKEIIPKVILDKKTLKLIDIVYSKTYDVNNISKIIIKSYKTMRLFHKFFVNDKLGIKAKIYSIIDKIFNTSLQPYSTSIKNNNIKLNIKKEWNHPSILEKKYNTSLNDLLNYAKKECLDTITETIKYINNEREDLNSIIKDIDYSTGLEIKNNKKMRYFKY